MKMQMLVEALLRKGQREGAFPTAVAAVGCQDRVLARAAIGPDTDESTRYDMASLSKLLSTTMVALRALERGEITLYDTLGRYFPDVPEDKMAITILQLMTHTAGFTPAFRLDLTVATPDEALGAIFARPLDTPPGREPHYSCMGYITLGKLLERACGLPLDELARRDVFGPLGMERTGYNPTGGNIAPTEVDPATGCAWRGVVHDENARFLGGVSGNAGIFSDIGDMCRYARMLSWGGEGFLSAATLRLATTNFTPGFDVHRGLGFHLAGTPENFMGDLFPADSFGHTGFTGTSLAVDPHTGLYAVLLTNRVYPTRESAGLFRFRRAFHNAVYAEHTRA